MCISKQIYSERLSAELCARLPGEPLRSLSFSASAHLQIRAHLSPLQPGCSWCSLGYVLYTAMQSVESLSVSAWSPTPGVSSWLGTTSHQHSPALCCRHLLLTPGVPTVLVTRRRRAELVSVVAPPSRPLGPGDRW